MTNMIRDVMSFFFLKFSRADTKERILHKPDEDPVVFNMALIQPKPPFRPFISSVNATFIFGFFVK